MNRFLEYVLPSWYHASPKFHDRVRELRRNSLQSFSDPASNDVAWPLLRCGQTLLSLTGRSVVE